MAFFILSSKSPLYFVPATIPVRSRATTLFPCKRSGTSLLAILSASPSATAVFPTPGSPIRHGLFFERLESICITLSISFFLPMTGSISPFFAFAVRSTPYLSRVSVLPPFDAVAVPPFEKLFSSPKLPP